MSERLLKIVPRDRASDLATQPIGTGPFRFISYTPGDRLVLEKNPDYFEKGKPKLDSITLLIMPEPRAQIAALKAGDADLLWNVPLEDIQTLGGNSSLVLDTMTTGSWDMLVMNNEIAPFNDVRVRRAVLLALDKKALMEFATFGHGAPTHSPIPPTSPYFNTSIPFRTDPVEAKRLLAEAGYPNGFSVDLYTPANRPTRDRLGVVAREMLERVRHQGECAAYPIQPLWRRGDGQEGFLCRRPFRAAEPRQHHVSVFQDRGRPQPARMAF